MIVPIHNRRASSRKIMVGFGAVLRAGTQPRFRLAGGISREPAGGDVDIEADHAAGLASGVVEDLSPALDPASAAGGGADAVVHRPVVKFLVKQFVKLRHGPAAVVGMQAFDPQLI